MLAGQEEIQQLTVEELDEIHGQVPDSVYLQATYASYPSVWIEANLKDPNNPTMPFKVRDYQLEITDDHSRFKILRMSRQIGKTLLLAAMAIWKAICVPGSKIIVTTPRESQVKNIFGKIKTLIANADITVRRMKVKITSTHPMAAIFTNGSIIEGYTAAKATAIAGGSSIRGQSASDLFIDEADYIDDVTMTDDVMPVISSYKFPSIWMSSTPTGRVGPFYKEWYSGRYNTYHYTYKVNPSLNEEMEARIMRLDRSSREHEYLAEWGSNEAGVFRTSDIDMIEKVHSKIIKEGQQMRNYSYQDQATLMAGAKYRLVGVDWNNTKGTRIVAITVDETNKICIVHKERIPKSEFAQHEAIAKIRDLDRWFNPSHIAVDVGHGDMQIEELRLLTVRNPMDPIGKKIVPVETGGMITILDPLTMEERQTYVKSFVVKSAVRTVEQGILTLPMEEFMSNDKKQIDTNDLSMGDQMRNYYVEKINASGREIYACKSDHDLDALMFAIYAYVTEILHLNNLFDLLPNTTAVTVSHEVIQRARDLATSVQPRNPVPTRSISALLSNSPVKRMNVVSRSLNFESIRSRRGRYGR
jgi:hypothetical protein